MVAPSTPRTPYGQTTNRGRDAPRGAGDREGGAPRAGGSPGAERGGGGDRGGFRGAPQANGNDRRRMLDVRREGHLKYDLREILVKSTVLPAEQIPTFIATVISKGARQSTGDAKDWVTAKMNEGVIAKPDRDAVNTLLDRYSKWR